ncbi:CoA transferase [Microbacterium aerolatum]|uniref:CoA transferase n=1 Tax=Microbacterium aerolatum TaxID=153731 RepID=UPI001E3E9383|nr:CoA transferase [Microbacterium aerolatum]
MDPTNCGRAVLARVAKDLGIEVGSINDIPGPAAAVPLPSRLATAELAWASVASVLLATGTDAVPALDADRIALSYRSDRFLRIDGEAPDVWSPYSGFWPTADWWVRTHGNYPHHAAALLDALDLPQNASADEVRAMLAAASARESAQRISAAGGLAVVVSPENPARDAALREQPLVDIRRAGDAPQARPHQSRAGAPLRGIRVLDLTRVIAGPVCTRTLALLGADVLRIDPPHLPEPEWQHLDTGHGKRSTILDARSPEMSTLLAHADVVVLGYRPAALDRLGLSPAALAERHPHLVVAQLSAWGTEYPERAGFDSLVQAESGIALVESPDGETPGVLPAQALDHSAGYLLAAGIVAAIRRRRDEGGSWRVSTSLRRVAAELLGLPRHTVPTSPREIDPADHMQDFAISGRTLTIVRSALPGFSFAAPRPWGSDAPEW